MTSDNKDASSQAPQSSDKPTPTQSGNNNNDNKASTTAKASGSGKASDSGGKTTGKPNKTYDPRLPAGGISMITPNALAGDQFYKVGQYVTFAWNYTSLSVTPSAIDILASCSANQATYTIAVNQSAQETKIVWDTKNTPDGQAPFLTEKYTLLIYDAESSVTAAPRAGYLGVFNQFTFGMYTPQPYVPWNGKLHVSSPDYFQLTCCRISMRKLCQERRPFTLREKRAQGHAHHLRHDRRLPRLLRPQLWAVVVPDRISHLVHSPIYDARHSFTLHTCPYIHTPLRDLEESIGAQALGMAQTFTVLRERKLALKVRRWGGLTGSIYRHHHFYTHRQGYNLREKKLDHAGHG